jgi:error-prone DNA polymerase
MGPRAEYSVGRHFNVIVWPSVFEKNRRAILGASLLGCRGEVGRAGDVIHLVVEHVVNLTMDLKTASDMGAVLAGGRPR